MSNDHLSLFSFSLTALTAPMRRVFGHPAVAAGALAVALASTGHAQTIPLADQALFSVNPVPGNMALALSVEFPTAVSVAHLGDYSSANTYVGYFDPAKCYRYRSSGTDSTNTPNTTAPDSYFYPDGSASNRTCNYSGGGSGKWSGNFLNWATMQTIDPFRWALTGGHRVIDTATSTVLEKAWASGQGGTSNFPNRSITGSSLIRGATPLTGLSTVYFRVQGLGNKLRFSSSSGNLDATNVTLNHYTDGQIGTANTVYEVFGRAKVCDTSSSAGPLESNCVAYGANYKPEGLIQGYSDRIRYSAFGYLNDNNLLRDGGVLRARQKFVGPIQPVPGAPSITNTAAEWDAGTGVFITNPNPTDASTTASAYSVTVTNSGVINYLNKFGRSSNAYKTFDPVSELYYAALRYYKNLGNVSSWTSVPANTSAATRATWVDNFPVITTWDDPIQYSCQKNFILGIGDVNTHADKNVPGAGTSTADEPTKPSFGDTVDAVQATNRIGILEGLGSSLGTTTNYNGCCNNNSTLMAGLAYDANTMDIRPDVNGRPNTLGRQTVSTFWLDVMEYQTFRSRNQYLLAAKYGGFQAPSGFNPYTNTTPLSSSLWNTTGDRLPDNTLRPDNYFMANAPTAMITGLTRAFQRMDSTIRAFSTSFSTTLPQVSLTGNASYSTEYDSADWSGEVTAKTLSFDSRTNTPELSLTPAWTFSSVLGTQAAAQGWDTARRIVSWDPVARRAVAFRATGTSRLSDAQLALLDTDFAGVDSANYVNYLRGDRTNEVGSTATSSTRAYRARSKLVGDIEGAKAVPVGPPAFPFDEGRNPGYDAFKASWRLRRSVVYVAANDGMLHAINGALTGADSRTAANYLTNSVAGQELFAYVPSFTLQGPNGTANIDGLAALGKTPYIHKYFVNATPVTFDVDLANTISGGRASGRWATLLVGGLGKGGKGYYALDITDPETSRTEADVARKVKWEFTDDDMGYSYGEPLITKTLKYGWVVIFASGYNNRDGRGYFFFVDPDTGRLLEKVATPSLAPGMAQLNGYVSDYADGTSDYLYAGDLDGNVWRLDVTGTDPAAAYPAPQVFARLTDGTNPQPITSKPVIEYTEPSKRRFVMVGTGRLLHADDMASTQDQSFYSINDGTWAFGDVSAIGSTPVGRSDLHPLTESELLTGASIDYGTLRGWYLNLGRTANGDRYRVIFRPSSFENYVTFSATALDASNPCSPSGTSRIFRVDAERGESDLLDQASGQILRYVDTGANVTDLRDMSIAGRHAVITGTDAGDLSKLETRPRSGVGARRLHWREVPAGN